MSLKKVGFGLIFFIAIGVFSYQFMMNSSSVTNITTDELAEKLAAADEKVVFLDVREVDEFAAGHVEGMTNVPLSTLSEDEVADIPKDSEVVLFCRSGNRSLQAAEKLQGYGYTNLVNVEGGISSWDGEIVQ